MIRLLLKLRLKVNNVAELNVKEIKNISMYFVILVLLITVIFLYSKLFEKKVIEMKEECQLNFDVRCEEICKKTSSELPCTADCIRILYPLCDEG